MAYKTNKSMRFYKKLATIFYKTPLHVFKSGINLGVGTIED
jgi:hypothetical protein